MYKREWSLRIESFHKTISGRPFLWTGPILRVCSFHVLRLCLTSHGVFSQLLCIHVCLMFKYLWAISISLLNYVIIKLWSLSSFWIQLVLVFQVTYHWCSLVIVLNISCLFFQKSVAVSMIILSHQQFSKLMIGLGIFLFINDLSLNDLIIVLSIIICLSIHQCIHVNSFWALIQYCSLTYGKTYT